MNFSSIRIRFGRTFSSILNTLKLSSNKNDSNITTTARTINNAKDGVSQESNNKGEDNNINGGPVNCIDDTLSNDNNVQEDKVVELSLEELLLEALPDEVSIVIAQSPAAPIDYLAILQQHQNREIVNAATQTFALLEEEYDKQVQVAEQGYY